MSVVNCKVKYESSIRFTKINLCSLRVVNLGVYSPAKSKSYRDASLRPVFLLLKFSTVTFTLIYYTRFIRFYFSKSSSLEINYLHQQMLWHIARNNFYYHKLPTLLHFYFFLSNYHKTTKKVH